MEFDIALGIVSPVYNLIMAVIVLLLFIRFFKLPNRLIYLKPWKVMFVGFLIYLFEEGFTVLRNFGVFDFPRIVNGIFEMFIISLFIYALLLQKEYLQQSTVKPEKKKPKKSKK